MRSADLLFFLVIALLQACRPEPVPKPRGYFRIDLPAKRYEVMEVPAPFVAEIPGHARLEAKDRQRDTSRWFDLRFSGQRAIVHLTWSPVGDDLHALIEDAHIFKGKHEAKALGIGRERVIRAEDRVFGTIFHVEGDVASPLVFYLTDSTTNFLYGALYFDARPNADSLSPVTTRIREDMRHFCSTLRWTP
ncbi:MAG: hypothetical protein KIT10_07705 [Flavobacteriales bacterium]|nr:hypothetical protein [Flavobacteriales bacterium]